MAMLLILMALLTGGVSFAALVVDGPITAFLGAPVISSLMTFLGAVLINPLQARAWAAEPGKR
jgi:hypothetical protein